MSARSDQYLIKSIVSAAELLRCFESQSELLRLKQIIERTGFTKAKT